MTRPAYDLPTPPAANRPAGAPRRRGLLLGAAAAAGTAVVAAKVVPGSLPEATVAAAPSNSPKDAGYRLTEHVKRYYETART